MSDVDDRLTAALHADAPPTHDAMFRVEVRCPACRARHFKAPVVVRALDRWLYQ